MEEGTGERGEGERETRGRAADVDALAEAHGLGLDVLAADEAERAALGHEVGQLDDFVLRLLGKLARWRHD